MNVWTWVLGFGIVGVGSRFAIDQAVLRAGLASPVGTLSINVLGCLIAGFVFQFGGRELGEDPWRLGMVVGFCGGFTTFSGFGIQLVQLLSEAKFAHALAYAIATPILCTFATAGGFFLSRGISGS